MLGLKLSSILSSERIQKKIGEYAENQLSKNMGDAEKAKVFFDERLKVFLMRGNAFGDGAFEVWEIEPKKLFNLGVNTFGFDLVGQAEKMFQTSPETYVIFEKKEMGKIIATVVDKGNVISVQNVAEFISVFINENKDEIQKQAK